MHIIVYVVNSKQMLKIKLDNRINIMVVKVHAILSKIKYVMHPAPQGQQISLNPTYLPLMIGLPVGYKSYACSSSLKISDFSVLEFLWVTLWTRTCLYSHRWGIDTGQVQIKCCWQKQCFSKLKTVTRDSRWSMFLTASQFHWRYRFYLIFI